MPEFKSDNPTREEFERLFNSEMANFRGTEQEIVVFKSVAYRWFQAGQASVIVRAKHLVIDSTRSLDELREQLMGSRLL